MQNTSRKTFLKLSRCVIVTEADGNEHILGMCGLVRCKFPMITCTQCRYNH